MPPRPPHCAASPARHLASSSSPPAAPSPAPARPAPPRSATPPPRSASSPDRRGAGAAEGRPRERRAGVPDRQREHGQRAVAEAGQARQRPAGAAERGRHRDHPRHRHHRGNRLLPEPGRQEQQAGGGGRRDASVDRDLGRRPDQPVQRGADRRQRGSRRQGRAGGDERPDQRRARSHQDQHRHHWTPSSRRNWACWATWSATRRTSTAPRPASTRSTPNSTSSSWTRCRQVDIAYTYANVGPTAVNAFVAAGVKGLVHAGVGDGSLPRQGAPGLSPRAKRA
jgi:hypothetical protein